MKNPITLLFLLLVATTVWGQTSEQYEAEYLLLERHYKTNDDGTTALRVRKELRLLRNSAITAYALNGESFIVHNPAFEQLQLHECYTERRDGSRIVPRDRAFVDQLPESCADCGPLNGIRELAIVHTGLEEGCTVVLDYTIRRNSTVLLDHYDRLQRYPVRRMVVTIDGDTVADERHLPRDQWAETPYAARPADSRQTVLLGTLPVWEAEQTLPAAARWLDTMSGKGTMQQVEAIGRWVREHIVCHHGLDLMHVDYQLAPAAQTYAMGCGTPVDAVALTAALLNEAGLVAELWCDTTVEDLAESLRVEVTVNGVPYRFNPLAANTPQPVGLAVDMPAPITVDTTLPYQPQALADGYWQQTIPETVEAFNIKPERLTPSRSLDVAVKPCHEHYRYTIQLPRKTYLMGDKIEVERTVKGVGQIKTTVRQKGRKVIVDREIVIETDRIDADHYADFRRLVQDWQQGKTLLFRTK